LLAVNLLARLATRVWKDHMDISQGRVTSADGTQIAYERSGSGPVIVLVSPALGDHTANEQLAGFLSRNLTVINYDRRGRGASTDTPHYAVEREVEDIEALIDAAGASAYLFGSSSGAVLALEAANRLDGKVRALFMYEPPFIVDSTRPPLPADYLQHLRDLLSADRRAEAVEYFMSKAVGVPDDMLAQMRQAAMWPSLELAAPTLVHDGEIMADTMSGNPLPPNRWASVAAPALVMDGEKSPDWMHHAAMAIAALLPKAQYRTLEGLDHSAMMTAPLDIATTMYAFFLKEHMGGRPA
jgi:pimeloyl-ACP methyl ester carboxylesterase